MDFFCYFRDLLEKDRKKKVRVECFERRSGWYGIGTTIFLTFAWLEKD